jgi:hypothetical protein
MIPRLKKDFFCLFFQSFSSEDCFQLFVFKALDIDSHDNVRGLDGPFSGSVSSKCRNVSHMDLCDFYWLYFEKFAKQVFHQIVFVSRKHKNS